jgi:hypothetical protein
MPLEAVVGIHALIVNECLNGPDISFEGPVESRFVVEFALHATKTLTAASNYFRRRALGIYGAHLSAEAQ